MAENKLVTLEALDYYDSQIKNLINKTAGAAADLDGYLPRNMQNAVVTEVTSGAFVEKSKGLEAMTYNTNNFTIRDSKASGQIDMSGTVTHGIVENMHLTNENAGFNINKETGWFGSNKFRNIFTNGCAYPFTVLTTDSTDLHFDGLTIENSRIGMITNTWLNITNSYFGDNNLTADHENPDCALLVKSGARVTIADSVVGCGVRNGQNNPVIRIESTSDNPVTVNLERCHLVSNSQNVVNHGYGGVFEASCAEDRVFIDDCRFSVYPSRVNSNHSVAPYVLKPFRTAYSHHPFYSYLCGGLEMTQVAFCAGSNPTKYHYDESDLVNPFGGKLITYDAYSVDAFYHIPKELVGTKMWLHVYCTSLSEGVNTPAINYENSDCEQTGFSKNFENGQHGDVTPYLNILGFTPTKEMGKVSFYVGVNGQVGIAAAALVENHYKEHICAYKLWDRNYYSNRVPRVVDGIEVGQLVYNIDGSNSWKWSGTEWTEVKDGVDIPLEYATVSDIDALFTLPEEN